MTFSYIIDSGIFKSIKRQENVRHFFPPMLNDFLRWQDTKEPLTVSGLIEPIKGRLDAAERESATLGQVLHEEGTYDTIAANKMTLAASADGSAPMTQTRPGQTTSLSAQLTSR